MEKFMSRTVIVLIYGVILLFITKKTSSVVYPSIMWHAENPLFKGPHCNGEKYANMYLDSTSRITFLCPKQDFTTFMKKQTYDTPEMSNENLFLVTKEEFESCNITKYNKNAQFLVEEATRLSLVCQKLPDFEIQYKEFQLSALASSVTGYEFKVNKTYYFISTSDGRLRENGEEQNLQGGRCKNNNMRLAIHICSSKSKCRDCQNMCCPDINGPTRKPLTESTTTGSTTPTTATPIVSQNSETHSKDQNRTSNNTHTDSEPNLDVDSNVPHFSYNGNEKVLMAEPELPVPQQVGKPLPRRSESTSSLTTTALVLFFAGIAIGAGAVLLVSIVIKKHKQRRNRTNNKFAAPENRDSVAYEETTIKNDDTATLRRQQSQYNERTEVKRLLSTASNYSGGSSENGSEVSDNCIACV